MVLRGVLACHEPHNVALGVHSTYIGRDGRVMLGKFELGDGGAQGAVLAD